MLLGNIKNITTYTDARWNDWFSTEGLLDNGDKAPPSVRIRYLIKISIITKCLKKNIQEA
jgi:hypothetical protein